MHDRRQGQLRRYAVCRQRGIRDHECSALARTGHRERCAIERSEAPAKESAALEKARLLREEKEERASDRAAQAAAVQRKKCGKLKLNKQWADEDVRRAATITNIDNAKLRAKRAGETLALECPK
jgi:hypothetical protein